LAKYRILTGPGPFPNLNDASADIVVIDTLRASSTVVTALSLGIDTIIPTLDDRLAYSLKCETTKIAGEAAGVKIPGYDMGNSPVELVQLYRDAPFSTLVLKTSNFVPLVLSLPSAVICSTLNIGAVARFLGSRGACIVAAGGRRGIAEDLGTALALGGLLAGLELDSTSVKNFVRESAAARHLCGIGYDQDVEFIARVNVFDIVALYDGRVITKAAL
jgi:2-phosphosulfolactate phosphatase